MSDVKVRQAKRDLQATYREIASVRDGCAEIKKLMDERIAAMSDDEALSRAGIELWIAKNKMDSAIAWIGEAMTCLRKADEALLFGTMEEKSNA